jgi:hypothetical protein
MRVSVFDDKEQRIGKAAQKSAAQVLEDDWKLSRFRTHPLDQGTTAARNRSPRPGTSLSY